VRSGGSRRWLAFQQARGLDVLAREQVLDTDLRVDHGSPQASFAAVGLGELAGAARRLE